MTNRLTKGAALVGDILLDGAKLPKKVRIRIGVGGVAISASSYVNTTYVLPSQAVVYDAFLNVLVASTGGTKTISVGTSGTPLGFLSGIGAGTTGLSLPVIAAGTSGAGTYGSLLFAYTTGNAPVQKSYASDASASRTIGVTPGSTDWVGGVFSADLYLEVVDLTQ